MSRGLFLIALLLATAAAASSPPRRSTCTGTQFDDIKGKIKSAISKLDDKKRWPGRLLRAGFHDCLPKACDGSIKHELKRGENMGIDVTVELLDAQIRGSCCSLADAIKLGMAVSMELSGGPSFSCPLKTTSTASTPNPSGKIPQPFTGRRTLLSKFPGFTTREVLAGNFGGHSLGRFEANVFRQITIGFPFTPTQDKFNNRFARFMVDPFFNAAVKILNPLNWNNLLSDRALSLRFRDRRVLRGYVRRSDELERDFGSFMTKLCNRR